MISSAINIAGIAFIHLGALAALVRGGDVELLVLAFALFVVRMFAITAGYHRYFSHKAFDTSRIMQLMIALVGVTCVMKGPIWWAAIHRAHHARSDGPGDPHSPRQHGFWTSHMGWWMGTDHDVVDERLVRDLLKYRELRVVDRCHALGSVALIAALAFTYGVDGVLFGYCLSTLVLHHVVFSINSVTHLWGDRPHKTRDDSRNVALLGLLGLGEGWHNNHHAFPGSVKLGHHWWQLDVGYLGLRALSAIGLVWNLKGLPQSHSTNFARLSNVERSPTS